MPHYRAYIFDEQGQLVGAVDFDCADDEEATAHAGQLGGHAELWRQVPLPEPDTPHEPVQD
ncbi:MAG: hypothetical protein ACRECL_14025 [Bradyrhizobium sp.]